MSAPSINDQFVQSQASLSSPGFQSMQEANEWLEIQLSTSLTDTDGSAAKTSSVPDEVLGILDDLFLLALTAGELRTYGKVRAVMTIASETAKATGDPLFQRYGSPKAQERFDLAAEVASNPESLVFSILFALRSLRSGDVSSAVSQGARLGKIVDQIYDLKNNIDTILTQVSAEETAIATVQVASKLLSPQSETPPTSSSRRVGTVLAQNACRTPWSPPSDSDDIAERVAFSASTMQSASSIQRDLLGTSPHFIWGDPQKGQYRMSDGTPSDGLNQFGDTLPNYLGGTAPEQDSDQSVDAPTSCALDTPSDEPTFAPSDLD